MNDRLDLLLVNAPSRLGVYGKLSEFAAKEPPVWAGLLARYCLNRGFSVRILDAEAEGLNAAETAHKIMTEHRPRLAVFCIYGHQPSASTQCMPAAEATARRLRFEQHSETPTLALGTHPSALPERTLREGTFDFVCQGEGPSTIESLLLRLKLRDDIAELSPSLLVPSGLWYKFQGRNNMQIACGRQAQNITDLDAELPGQAWELLDMRRYRAHNWHLWAARPSNLHEVKVSIKPGGQMTAMTDSRPLPAGGYASVQTSLGCPYACTFCCINAPFGGRGYRRWSPANVAGQIERLVRTYGITNIKIPDEMFVLNREHVVGICDELINRGLGDALNMWAYARIDTVKDSALLALMRRAGFRWLGVGVESGSKHVRDGVEKGRFGNEEIARSVARIRAEGIAVGANYIFGLPDDTRASCAETLALACELNTEWANFYCAMAYPGSPLHAEAQKRGWPLPEDPGGPGWIGYSQHAYETLPLPTETLSAAEVLDIRDTAFMTYFSRPEYQGMLAERFGPHAVAEVHRMLAAGRPKRKLLNG